MRITYDREYKYITTGIKVQPERWDDKHQIVVGIVEAKSYNLILSRMRTRAMEIISDMDRDGHIDIGAIPAMMKAKKVEMTFLEFVESRIDAETGVKSYNTIKNHLTFLSQMRQWGKIVHFKDVTLSNVEKMNTWLKRRGLRDESIYGYNKHLRQFINDAVSDGLLKENPYSGGKIKLKHGEPNADNFITDDELERIKAVELPTENLMHVRDLFVFQCLTGMAYADMAKFDARKIKEIDGYKTYSGKRGKTGVPFVVVLLDDALAILQRYEGKLPLMTNQQYNMRLKVVAEAAGLDKKLTTHWARHTAATHWINKGVPIEIISRMLGHSSTKITEKVYSRLQEKTIVGVMGRLKK